MRIKQQKRKVQEISITPILSILLSLINRIRTLLNTDQFGKETRADKTYTPKENTFSGEITYS